MSAGHCFRSDRSGREAGFTLVETLIVMLILGLLAGISTPTFLSQKRKARDVAAKADVAAIGKQLSTYYVDGRQALAVSGSAGSWTAAPTSDPAITGLLSSGNTATGAGVSTDAWCVAVTAGSAGTGTTYSYSAAKGLRTGPCTGTPAVNN